MIDMLKEIILDFQDIDLAHLIFPFFKHVFSNTQSNNRPFMQLPQIHSGHNDKLVRQLDAILNAVTI